MLKENERCKCKTHRVGVLILILMEHAQRVTIKSVKVFENEECLNPYFNGTCSKRPSQHALIFIWEQVLILILMEHAQRGCNGFNLDENISLVLILILMEHAQRAYVGASDQTATALS